MCQQAFLGALGATSWRAWKEAGDLTRGVLDASLIQVHAGLVGLLDVVYVTYLVEMSVGWEFHSWPQESDYI